MVSEVNEALQVEDGRMREYEMVFIISPRVEGEALDAAVDNVSQFITGKGGVISSIDRWGKKRLAYPINHFLEGSYVLVRFKMEPEWGKELEGKLEISEDVLRHLLIKIE